VPKRDSTGSEDKAANNNGASLKTGLGVGLGVGLPLALAVIWWLRWWRRRSPRRDQESPTAEQLLDWKEPRAGKGFDAQAGVPHRSDTKTAHEVGGRDVVELPPGRAVVEASADSERGQRWELEGLVAELGTGRDI
jgi:hypothetical protein